MAHPPIVSREEWLAQRKELLAQEKELTHRRDALNAARRRLPMVKVDKNYVFESPEGKKTLLDLFEGRDQLIVYHFMFEPGDPPPGKSGAPWEEGCPGCSFVVDNIGHLAHLHARNTSLAVVSRAPLAKIQPFKRRMGWTIPWYSSFGSDFNYDFHATIDDAVAPVEYNFQNREELGKSFDGFTGELPGLSVFLRVDDDVFHTYSAYARGLDQLDGTYIFLDLTPYGRQESWENSPEGWPQDPTHSWLRHHDKYENLPQQESCCSSRDQV